MDQGFIKLHRKLIDWEWFADSKTFHVFMYLLLDANHTEKKWRGITVARGQTLTGRIKISEATGISQQSVRTALSNLSSTDEITIQSTNRYSIITICNYNKYQSLINTINQPDNQQPTNSQPATNQQPTTNKNEKKELKPTYTEPFLMFWKVYPNKTGKGKAFDSWLKMGCDKLNGEILVAIDWQKNTGQWIKDNGQFIPHPATWLNQRRWEDEKTEETTKKHSWEMGG